MKDFVLDASIALAWCFYDEATNTTNTLLESLGEVQAFVPSLWPLEIGNILIHAERRHRITRAEISTFLALIAPLPIIIDAETSTHAFHNTLSLAQKTSLTTYDAAYIELAMRKGLPLATKDKQLHKIAKMLGIVTI
jgi:predicted nucleic acid-binding protein